MGNQTHLCGRKRLRPRPAHAGLIVVACYTLAMTRQLEDVVADIRALAPDEQDRIASVILTYLQQRDESGYAIL